MPTKINIIGISGTNGSGKDTMAHILSRQLNYQFVSIGDILRNQLISQNIEPIRENTRKLSSQLQHQFNGYVLVDRALELFEPTSYDGIVVSAIRNTSEAERIKQLGGKLIWVDAKISTRYKRIHGNIQRNRRDDNLTFNEFEKQENEEMTISATNDNLNSASVKNLCDFTIINNSGLEELEKKLAEYFPV